MLSRPVGVRIGVKPGRSQYECAEAVGSADTKSRAASPPSCQRGSFLQVTSSAFIVVAPIAVRVRGVKLRDVLVESLGPTIELHHESEPGCASSIDSVAVGSAMPPGARGCAAPLVECFIATLLSRDATSEGECDEHVVDAERVCRKAASNTVLRFAPGQEASSSQKSFDRPAPMKRFEVCRPRRGFPVRYEKGADRYGISVLLC